MIFEKSQVQAKSTRLGVGEFLSEYPSQDKGFKVKEMPTAEQAQPRGYGNPQPIQAQLQTAHKEAEIFKTPSSPRV
jgi:hypothetical protein